MERTVAPAQKPANRTSFHTKSTALSIKRGPHTAAAPRQLSRGQMDVSWPCCLLLFFHDGLHSSVLTSSLHPYFMKTLKSRKNTQVSWEKLFTSSSL